MSDKKSIIEPGAVQAKVPLKKSTVAWIVGILLGLAIVGYTIPRLTKSMSAPEEQTVDKQRNRGSGDQIDAEMRELNQRVKDQNARGAAPAARPASAPIPTPLPAASASTIQPATRGNSQQANQAMEEMEASARTSRSVMVDGGFLSGNESPSATDRKAANPQSELDEELAQVRSSRAGQRSPEEQTAAQYAQLLRAQGDPQSRDLNREWLKEYAEVPAAKAIRPSQVKNQYTLIQGKVIPAVLGKSLNSDLPGDITAFTTIDIYDSLSGRYLLIPKGSMLMGEYSNRLRAGQERIMFAFNRIVLPNGVSFDLPGNKGEDQTGASGLTGDVNNHYVKRFASGLFIALLADRLESGNTQPVTNIGTTGGGPNTAAGRVLAEMASADLGRNKDIPPTITVEKGTRINVQVAADMEFPTPYMKRGRQ